MPASLVAEEEAEAKIDGWGREAATRAQMGDAEQSMR
jgi:hypothetical protein